MNKYLCGDLNSTFWKKDEFARIFAGIFDHQASGGNQTGGSHSIFYWRLEMTRLPNLPVLALIVCATSLFGSANAKRVREDKLSDEPEHKREYVRFIGRELFTPKKIMHRA